MLDMYIPVDQFDSALCPECDEPVGGEYTAHPDCCPHAGSVDPSMDFDDPARESRDRGVCTDCGVDVHLEHDEDRVYWEAD